MQTTTSHLFVDTLGARVISRRGFVKGSKKSATAPLLRGCFTGYNKMKNRDVRLCGTAWLHPEIPFCTQTGLSICKDTTSNDVPSPLHFQIFWIFCSCVCSQVSNGQSVMSKVYSTAQTQWRDIVENTEKVPFLQSPKETDLYTTN